MSKSTGPKTPAGKAAASQNAVKHGLRSGAPVIPELESFEEWEVFRDAIVASYAPEGGLETDLAEQSAALRWRSRRATRYETDMTAQHLQDIPDDMVEAAAYGERALKIPAKESITPDKVGALITRRRLPPADVLERVMRYEAHLHRLWVQVHHELEAIQARRKGERVSSLTRIDVAASPGLGG